MRAVAVMNGKSSPAVKRKAPSRATALKHGLSLTSTIEGYKPAPRSFRSKMDTILITPEVIGRWERPDFQRPLRVNARVHEVAHKIKADEGVIPGTITLGVVGGVTYLVDGQHRSQAFLLSELAEGYADVRICEFESMADMAAEFADLNSSIVTMSPDDRLRAKESSNQALQHIRKECPFVGYGGIRRSAQASTTAVVSMSQVLRVWFGSGQETPSMSGFSGSRLGDAVTMDDALDLVQFLRVCLQAWGRDPEYYRLWSSLNLILTAWLWRNIVIKRFSDKSVMLTPAGFTKCLMSLTDASYLDWLLGKNGNNERDRSPGYSRITALFKRRLEMEDGVDKKSIKFPAPAWTLGGSR